MHILMLHVEGLPAPFGLRFDDFDKAMGVLTGIREAHAVTTLDMADDYGQHISVPRSRLLVPQLFDVAKDLEAKAEMQLAEAQANARLQQRAQTDPVLSMHRINNQGMAMGQMVRPQ